MIGFLRGKIVERQPTQVLMDVQGVGYEVIIPVSTYEKIQNEDGDITLMTYLHVREDAMQLFGFHTAEEKALFLKLIQVNGVGPKVAIGVLSGCSVDEFKRSVREGDIARLKTLPGIGKKTAERIVLELKDKVDAVAGAAPAVGEDRPDRTVEEALLALVSLGYSKGQAEKIIQQLLREGAERSVEELIRLALQKM
ncbi:MAG: Holliday junction branch migration protein RuvA [candidate division KSB1 bacterium]|nr:Holliday junction branch migration protein RuvA [candidate division KSB1 bacterium]